MSMFTGARGVIIEGGSFTAKSNTTNITNSCGRSGIDILYEASDPGAAIDSQDHYDRRCFPGTREQYISDITNWVTEFVDSPASMYWMRGPAGVGKSAIAQTCAEKLKDTGHLGAAFFFTFKKYDNPLRLFTSIAFQLTTVLPDYHDAVNERISKDRSLVGKKIPAQFRSLIVEPLCELGKQGKRIQPQAIFIDGLDECAGGDAQAEIIKIIASSIKEGSTPFYWAIFSRAEPRIVSTFKQDSIASVIHSVELSISREADGEIEMYLRGGFKNILEQQDFPQPLSSWPSDNDIRMLVDAADGLFAHPAAVLRVVSYPPDSQFRERLQSVLDSLSGAGKQGSTSALSQLDALYVHIMEQIPEHNLLSAQFLLSYDLGNWITDTRWGVSLRCCMFRISGHTFRDIYHHLHAVISYKPSFDPLSSIDPRIDLTRPCYDQDQWFHLDQSIERHVRVVHGSFNFHHKSFYDFLHDPIRSGSFCVNTPDIYCKYLGHLIQCHHHYASSYGINGSNLVSAPGIISSSTALSWPHGTEFTDSCLKLTAFSSLSFQLSCDEPDFCQFFEDIPFAILQRLADVDYRKSLIADRTWSEYNSSNHFVFGIPATVQTLSHTTFECVGAENFDELVPDAFIRVVNKLEKAKVIRPYVPLFGSGRASALLHTLSRKKSARRNSGLYKLGHGEKSVIWYWEFDVDKRYFHQFKTIDYAAAAEFYEANKLMMRWEDVYLDINSVPPEHKKEGADWFAVFNPRATRQLEVSLVHMLMHESFVSCVRFSTDGKYLATGCDRTAQIYDIKTGEKTCVLVDDIPGEAGDLSILSVCFSPDGKYLATGASDKQIRIWDIAEKRIHNVFDGHQQTIYSLDFSTDGRLIVSGSGDETVRIWDMVDGTSKVLTINNHDSYAGVNSVAISPNGQYVAAGSMDAEVRIWDVSTGQLVERLRGHWGGIRSVAFTPDGKGLVSGSWDKTLKFWDLSGMGAVAKRKSDGKRDDKSSPCTINFTGHKDYVRSVAVSHDGQWVVSGSEDSRVRFWDAKGGDVQCILQGHNNWVNSIDLSPAGNVLATGSFDQKARIWSYNPV